jgi:hypothetical protein
MSTFADVTNGDFSDALNGWDYNSGVMLSYDLYYPDSAYLFPLAEEEQSPLYSSILSQAFSTDGMNCLTFSFNPISVGGDETDHFYASLLDSTYISTLNDSVVPAPGIDPVSPAQSLVSYGLSPEPYFFHWSSDSSQVPQLAEGVTMSSADEDGWITIFLMLPSGTDSATLRFELIHDYDPMDAETMIYIDRVVLSHITAVVPTPAAVLLAGLGTFLVVSFRRITG